MVLVGVLCGSIAFANEVEQLTLTLSIDEFERLEQYGSRAGSTPSFSIPERRYDASGELITDIGELFPGLKSVPLERRLEVFREARNNIRPHSIGDVLGAGLSWRAVNSLPSQLFEEAVQEVGFSEITLLSVLSILNVELFCPDTELSYPETARLFIQLVSPLNPQTQQVGVHLLPVDINDRFESGVYYLADPTRVINELQNTIEDIQEIDMDIPNRLRIAGQVYPRSAEFSIKRLNFENSDWFGETTELGTLLIHHINVGDHRVETGWQWAGRIEGIPGAQQPGFVE